MPDTVETKVSVLYEKFDHVDDRLHKVEEELKGYSQIMLSLQSINDSLKQVTDNIGSMNTRLQVLEQAPVRKWDTLVKTACTALISAVVGGAITWFITLLQHMT